VALHGFVHGDFSTTPWLGGVPANLAANTGELLVTAERARLLTELLAGFFGTYLNRERPQMALLGQKRADMDVFFRPASSDVRQHGGGDQSRGARRQ
jgi:hypothetical protein